MSTPDRSATRSRPPRIRFGEIGLAALLVAAASGVALTIAYDVRQPYATVSALLLLNPAATWFRNLHYWSGQLLIAVAVVHAWDAMRRGTEATMQRPVWARATSTVPVLAFVMLSGFLLRGDAEAAQAWRILATALGQLPIVGDVASRALLGVQDNLQVVYVHHVATGTILLWLFTVEHGRMLWPRARTLAATIAVLGALSTVASPSLHDGFDPVMNGPWYFIGVQELLHWTAGPMAIEIGAFLLVGAVVLLPALGRRARRLTKTALATAAVAYAAVTMAGTFRGEEGRLQRAWPPRTGAVVVAPVYGTRVVAEHVAVTGELPTVLGRREGCLGCHGGMRGLSASHRPEAIGCASCHGGNPFSLDAGMAHAGMVRIPGTLDVAARTCGTQDCHPSVVPRVSRSLMESMSGVAAVDRQVMGEASTSHVGQLCASCHLGGARTAFGPVDDATRGGGCNACHLVYSDAARRDLARYASSAANGQTPPAVHPDLSIRVTNDHCFGCHSRSGRISTNYEGWHETDRTTLPEQQATEWRQLSDGRVFRKVEPDVHFTAGMACIDCHTSREVMGDGQVHTRKHEATVVACEDCHARHRSPTVDPRAADADSRRILQLRNVPSAGERLLVTGAGAQALTGAVVDPQGRRWLIGKIDGRRHEIKPPAAACEDNAHARLSCQSCHTAWAPQCGGCHTRFDPRGTAYDHRTGQDVRGAWIEEGSDRLAGPPALGVRTIVGREDAPRDVIDTFAPGMIITADRAIDAGSRSDRVFRRLYARVAPHTTAIRSRSCASCHADPVALGYGRGTLRYERSRWRFAPAFALRPEDGLPLDAWIPFLARQPHGASTRDDVRPFTVAEQQRVLAVGACLGCHSDRSPAMTAAARDFTAARAACRRGGA